MTAWRDALWLAKFELKGLWKMSLLLGLLLFTIIVLFTSSFPSYLEDHFTLFDVLFIGTFSIVPMWMLPKAFQVKRVHSELYATPISIMLQHLPIKRTTIIKSRMIIYLVYAYILQIPLLGLLYLFSSDIRALMTPLTYIVFAMLWLSFSTAVGVEFVGGAIGISVEKKSNLFILKILLTFAIGIGIYFLLQYVVPVGIVHLTINLAQQWPFLTLAVSIVFAFVRFQYFIKKMKKQITKIDYL